jgi:hypothetical protein
MECSVEVVEANDASDQDKTTEQKDTTDPKLSSKWHLQLGNIVNRHDQNDD